MKWKVSKNLVVSCDGTGKYCISQKWDMPASLHLVVNSEHLMERQKAAVFQKLTTKEWNLDNGGFMKYNGS